MTARALYAGVIITMTVMPLFLLATGPGRAREIVVDDDGGRWADHTAIQDAVNVSQDGDVVRVFAGRYDAAVLLNKAVGLVGNGTKATFLTCTDMTASAVDAVIEITSDDVNISDLSIGFGRWLINSFRRVAVRCEARDGLEVVGCDLIQHRYDSGIGIVIGNCSRTLMVDCTFINNSQSIQAMNVSLELENCTFEGRGYATLKGPVVDLEGCTFESDSDAKIKNSSMPLVRGCSFGEDSRLTITDSIGSRIEDCEFSGNYEPSLSLHRADSSGVENCHFVQAVGSSHHSVQASFESFDSDGCSISNLSFTGGNLHVGGNNNSIINIDITDGSIEVQGDDNLIMNTTMTGGRRGISIHGDRNSMRYCFLNAWIGIVITGSNNIVTFSQVIGRVVAVEFGGTGSYNIFHHNDMDCRSEVPVRASDGFATWDDGAEGNHWARHKGNDTDFDGVLDEPFQVCGPTSSMSDRFPLLSPVNALKPVIRLRSYSWHGKMVCQVLDQNVFIDIVRFICNSSIDGPLYNGTNLTLQLVNLSDGLHTITFVVLDENGLWSDPVAMELSIGDVDNDGEEETAGSDAAPVIGLIAAILVGMITTMMLSRHLLRGPRQRR